MVETITDDNAILALSDGTEHVTMQHDVIVHFD